MRPVRQNAATHRRCTAVERLLIKSTARPKKTSLGGGKRGAALKASIPAATATWVLILTGITGLAFGLSAFAYDRLGYKIISAFLAAGAWLCAAFGALVWCWR